MIRHLPLLLVLGTPVFAAADGTCTQGASTHWCARARICTWGRSRAPPSARARALPGPHGPRTREWELIVSLEQQDWARDPASEAWRGVDGRGSVAMWDSTQFLITQEKAGRLELVAIAEAPA